MSKTNLRFDLESINNGFIVKITNYESDGYELRPNKIFCQTIKESQERIKEYLERYEKMQSAF